jgi:hypothetical protein
MTADGASLRPSEWLREAEKVVQLTARNYFGLLWEVVERQGLSCAL